MDVPSELIPHSAIIYDIDASVEVSPTVEWKVVVEVVMV